MLRRSLWLAVVVVALIPLTADAFGFRRNVVVQSPVVVGYAPAVSYYVPAPVVVYPPPVVTSYYVAPAPVVAYPAPAVAVTSYRTGFFGRRVITQYEAVAPVVTSYYAPPPVIIYP